VKRIAFIFFLLLLWGAVLSGCAAYWPTRMDETRELIDNEKEPVRPDALRAEEVRK